MSSVPLVPGWCRAVTLAVVVSVTHAGEAAEVPSSVKRDFAVIAACVAKGASEGQCIVVCDTVFDKASETYSCARTPHIDSLNEALSRRWSCLHAAKNGKPEWHDSGMMITPVKWIDERTATVDFGIPAGLAGPAGCTVKRTFFGWKARLGIRD
jgi:hypothetical protein